MYAGFLDISKHSKGEGPAYLFFIPIEKGKIPKKRGSENVHYSYREEQNIIKQGVVQQKTSILPIEIE